MFALAEFLHWMHFPTQPQKGSPRIKLGIFFMYLGKHVTHYTMEPVYSPKINNIDCIYLTKVIL